jgi:hypothetical protein
VNAIHVEVPTRPPLRPADMSKPSRYQHQGAMSVGKSAHDTSATADLLHDPVLVQRELDFAAWAALLKALP